MKNTIKAYIAGFMDGEGSISIRLNNKRNKYSICYYPFVSVSNTHKPTIKWINKLYGGKIVLHSKYEHRRRAKKLWKLTFYIHELKRFLTDLQPYLIFKKEQANIILEFLKIPRKIKNDKLGHIVRLTDEQIAYRKSLWKRYKLAQRNGRSAMPGKTRIKKW